MSRTGFGSPSMGARSVSLTLAGYRYVQAASTKARRARRLPARVRPLRLTVSPVELSAGTSPRNDISCRGVSNRRTSPISAAKVTATRNETPRMGAVLDLADKPDFAAPLTFGDRHRMLLLCD